RVGLRDLLELRLGLGVVRVAVRVVLERELAVRLLEVGGARVALEAEDLVVVALCHSGSGGPGFPPRHTGARKIGRRSPGSTPGQPWACGHGATMTSRARDPDERVRALPVVPGEV